MRDDAVCFVFGNFQCRNPDAKTFPLAEESKGRMRPLSRPPMLHHPGHPFHISNESENGEAGNLLGGSLHVDFGRSSLGLSY